MTERRETRPDTRGRTTVLGVTAATVIVTGAMLIGTNTPVTAVDSGSGGGSGRARVELAGVEAQAARVAGEKPPLAGCQGWVGLTFDDGPVEGTWGTERVVRVLEKLDVPGTFFMLGREMAEDPGAVRAVVGMRAGGGRGGEVGNGTWNHPDLRGLTERQVNRQLVRTNRVYGRIARGMGRSGKMKLWRPPYGVDMSVAARVAAGRVVAGDRMGMAETLWTVDPRNYRRMSVGEVVRESRGMVDGGILTLQDGRRTTVKALPRIVRHYWRQGLCIGVLQAAPGGWVQAPVESPALQFGVRAVKPRRY